MDFKRTLNLKTLLEKKSFFLFGPRQTGKTTLIKTELSENSIIIDLLRSEYYLKLANAPNDLESIILGHKLKNPLIIIDEIQKIPLLLNEVHRLIEEKKWRFLLTGSSARKLKRGDNNLLAGRAWKAELFPLTTQEIKNFNLDRYLRVGGLPSIYPSEMPEEELDAYINIYLKEEILQEGAIRKIPQFTRFLKAAALSNAQQINLSKLASDTGVPASTLREYFSILEDTLLGHFLEPWQASKKRKAVATAKFYFFDPGITLTLAGHQHLNPNTPTYGTLFEQFIGMELRAYLSYNRIKKELTFWRTHNGQEVDYIIGDEIAIEVKSSQKVSSRDLKGLKALQEENIIKNYYLVSQDPIPSLKENIHTLPWKIFLEKLWSGDIIV